MPWVGTLFCVGVSLYDEQTVHARRAEPPSQSALSSAELAARHGAAQHKLDTADGPDSHLSGIYARNPLSIPISSSQLISRDIPAAGLRAVQHPVAAALLLVQVGKIGDGVRVVGCGVGRRAHSNSGNGAGGAFGSASSACLRYAVRAGVEARRVSRDGKLEC